MDDSLQARIQHEIAELRATYPQITACHAVLEDWREEREHRYALRLDLRLPQHQSLLSGGAQPDAAAAVRAGFDAAKERLDALS